MNDLSSSAGPATNNSNGLAGAGFDMRGNNAGGGGMGMGMSPSYGARSGFDNARTSGVVGGATPLAGAGYGYGQPQQQYNSNSNDGGWN